MFCGAVVKEGAVSSLCLQQRGLCPGAPGRGCRQPKGIRSSTATVQASGGRQIRRFCTLESGAVRQSRLSQKVYNRHRREHLLHGGKRME